jgi:hypothetical protein
LQETELASTANIRNNLELQYELSWETENRQRTIFVSDNSVECISLNWGKENKIHEPLKMRLPA